MNKDRCMHDRCHEIFTVLERGCNLSLKHRRAKISQLYSVLETAYKRMYLYRESDPV